MYVYLTFYLVPKGGSARYTRTIKIIISDNLLYVQTNERNFSMELEVRLENNTANCSIKVFTALLSTGGW